MELEDPTMEAGSTIKLTVKFGGKSIPLSVSPDCTVKDLKSLLQPITNVLPRGQKLIFKGKVLVETSTLKQSDVGSGAKIMLMASQGLHQGEGPVLKEASTRPISRTVVSDKVDQTKPGLLVDKNRVDRWKATGVIALAQANLKEIPKEVWDCGSGVRVLDISENFIKEVPARISSFGSMQKLFLQGNGLSDESIQWEGISSLKRLMFLSISHNNLTVLPSAVGSLTSLRQLDVANNKLTSLPNELGLLTQLEILKANNNRITSLPESTGNCSFLMEVELSANIISELPETFTKLRNLKTLELNNTGLKTLPLGLFKMCLQLSTLGLHNTEITVEFLRQFEGWEDFDERRRTKHQKQLDFRVVGSGKFDEGADKSW
ncbi:PREDICTED: LRR repeats and ubiquitin-like domain-containing protein At2g30105 [Camelina sativa]|uniref:LRR repeats and ubiquitin-like domain-containing protein At2g30105 n=1 Tax=Camelina sativa TaxID=90675 RepID=A0ABM0SPP9_CAMSA|nr:PREDICTED: LRR repeats and ubiquitin-like domain-containing protein At2g30105 [Camelina sativa]